VFVNEAFTGIATYTRVEDSTCDFDHPHFEREAAEQMYIAPARQSRANRQVVVYRHCRAEKSASFGIER